MHDAVCRRSSVGLVFCWIGLLALAGCQKDKITHTIVPRASEPEKTRSLASFIRAAIRPGFSS